MHITFFDAAGDLSASAAALLGYLMSCVYFAYVNADAARLELRRAAQKNVGVRAQARAAREAWRRTVRVMWSPLWPLVAIASVLIWLIEYNRMTRRDPDPPAQQYDRSGDLPPV